MVLLPLPRPPLRGGAARVEYGCVGDFKKAWAKACEKAGFPVGRKNRGYVFHHTRNTATTNLVAAGLTEGDAMKVTGHATPHVFRHYDLGNVEALRERLGKRRAYVDRLPASGTSVTRLRDRGQPTQPAQVSA